MKLSYIFSIIFPLIAIGFPIYARIKKFRTKIVVVAVSIFSMALGVFSVLIAADMTNDKFEKLELIQEYYPMWENFYRIATVLVIVAVIVNIYYLAKPVED